MSEKQFLILHNHPEGLVMSQQQREMLFATGTVIDIRECSLHSVQPEFLKGLPFGAGTVLLWGMADRYEVAEQAGVQMIECRGWGDIYSRCDPVRQESVRTAEAPV